jgi:hypothetical protein
MTLLLWFHAFRRDKVEDLLEVLTRSAEPTPHGLSKTRMNEANLGLAPSTYAYLGRPHEDFGSSAFAMEDAEFSGEMSPFDSGGLVSNIAPVCHWKDDADRREYLRTYTWPTSQLAALLAAHPSAEKKLLGAYLRAERPPQAGPHEIWGGDSVDIWKSNSDWRAWTWEGRCPGAIPTGRRLFRWTCPPPVYVQLLDLLEAGDLDADFSAFIISRYIPGGVSFLMETLRVHQMGPR